MDVLLEVLRILGLKQNLPFERLIADLKYRTPGALVLAALLVAALAAPALAQDTSVVYLEGDPELRTSRGRTDWLDFGSTLSAGDSVVTGRNDFVELEQGSAATIRVNPDTVFTIREVEERGERRQVMSNSTGSVGYRFNRLAGRDEPRIGTSSVVAGVRGTEVVVYAGANGSSLFLVETGLVDVTSAGRTVSLVENEGVEVPAGGPPGEKFEWLGRTIDFSEWNSQQLDSYLENPADGTVALISSLDEFIAGNKEYYDLFQEFSAEREELYERVTEMEEGDERETLRQELLQMNARNRTVVLNYRYNALSALSLRRYVLGRMYVELTTRYMLDRNNPVYQDFLVQYHEFLDRFEEGIVPQLVEADI
jgi:hypothetical protein